MMDVPLTVGMLMRHGTTVHGAAEVVTSTGAGTRRASYAEVGRRAARLAGALRELGVSGDQRVATFQWNNQEHLEAYLAIPAMGAVLHTLNVRLFPDQVAWIANHAGDRVIIVDGSLIPLLAKALPAMTTVRHVVVCGPGDTAALDAGGVAVHDYESLLAAAPESFAWPQDVDERSAAALCYTSGTTGDPKGVAYSHRSLYLHSMAQCTGEAAGLSAADRVLPVVPMFHANAWGMPYAALLAGSSLIMPDRFLQADALIRLIESERPTVSGAVPTIWGDVLRRLRERPADVSSLRRVLCGGSAVPHSLMTGFADEQGVEIMQAWGMTETSPLAAVAAPPVGAEGEEYWRYRNTQGRVIAGVQVRIVGDDDAVLPADGRAVGEIQVRGPWVTGRYLGDAGADRFHDGWLRTGDVGTLDELGYITITDRAKDVIKSGGEWISSVALENALMGHPDVIEAAVVAVPDERWGERPLATVVLAEGASVTAEELHAHLAGSAPAWQLPERWAFLDQVPKTSVGKFDKKAIRHRHAEGELSVTEVGRGACPPGPGARL